MTIAEKIKPRPRRRSNVMPERLTWAKAKLGRWTTLAPDFGKLDDDEVLDVLDLVKKASATDNPEVDRFDPDLLGKRDRWKLERLVEKAADKPGAFKEAREQEAFKAEVAEITRSALATNPTREQEGRFFAEVIKQLRYKDGPCLHAEDVGVLTLTLASLFVGEMPPTSLSARVERGQDGQAEIHWRKGYPLFGAVDGELAGKMKASLEQLERNGWVSLTPSGQETRIGMGPRARRVFTKAKR